MNYEREIIKRSSNKEFAKWFIPPFVGTIIALLIWAGLLLSQRTDEQPIDPNFMGIALLIPILAILGPISIIEIYLMYRKKVIKMTPKSEYNIRDLIDYSKILKDYKCGNYEFETIKTETDIVETYEEGKVIMFPKSKTTISLGIGFGIGIIIFSFVIGIVSTVVFEDLFVVISLTPIFSGVGGFLLLQAYRVSKSFFMVTQQGIIYRNTWGFVRSYSWKELDLKIYSVKSTMRGLFKIELPPNLEIHIILPNKSVLRFEPELFDLKEFISLRRLRQDVRFKYGRNQALMEKFRMFVLLLVCKTFEYYFKQENDKLV